MKVSKVSATAIVLATVLFAASAQAAECNIASNLSAWGQSMSGTFQLAAGQSCEFAFKIEGTVNSSKIVMQPRHGSLKKINVSTFQYTAKPGYKGSDTFALEATGKGPMSAGTSRVTGNVTVQ